MRKVIVAFEAPNFSEGAMRFVNQMNEAEQVTVSGIFLPAAVYTAFWSYAEVLSTGILLPVTDEVKTSALNKSVGKFKQFCNDHHLRYRVVKNFTDFGLPDLKRQSRYADLIVLCSESFFNIPESEKLSDYLKTSLHDAECPVVVVPENFSTPLHNVLAYDGTESSARAIKNFSYLLPEMGQNTTSVVTFGAKNKMDKESEAGIKELISVHFPNHKFLHFDSESRKQFPDWTNEQSKSVIVVCGAYGRSVLSVLFRHSFIADLLEDHKVPVFISHR